jgi:hypothetical protein
MDQIQQQQRPNKSVNETINQIKQLRSNQASNQNKTISKSNPIKIFTTTRVNEPLEWTLKPPHHTKSNKMVMYSICQKLVKKGYPSERFFLLLRGQFFWGGMSRQKYSWLLTFLAPCITGNGARLVFPRAISGPNNNQFYFLITPTDQQSNKST